MQDRPQYDDVVREVIDFLRERVDVMTAAGIERERLCIGFRSRRYLDPR